MKKISSVPGKGIRAALIAVVLSIVILFAQGIFAQKIIAAAGTQEIGEEKEIVNIRFFHNNPCESCREEDKFADIVRDELLGEKEEFPYEFQVINVFKTKGNEEYQTLLDHLGLRKSEAECPLMIIGNRYVSGYEEIKENIAAMVREEAVESSSSNLGVRKEAAKEEPGTETKGKPSTVNGEWITGGSPGEEAEIRLFTTFSCTECEKVKNKLSTLEIPVLVTEYNISQTENARLMLDSFEAWGVPGQEQQVPILFWNGSYASGSEDIIKVLETSDWYLGGEEAPSLAGGGTSFMEADLTWKDFLKITGAGLLNGLNPCALSMLFFLLSLLSGTQGKTGRLGGAYLLGKFLAYLCMGVGLISLLASVEDIMVRSYQVMKLLLLAGAVFLAVMNFMDFLHVVRKEYGKVRMQLPASLRKWNQLLIRKLGSREGKGLWIIIFLLGIVISAGEFFCTGQIYAATLLMLFRTGSGIRILVFLAIVCYVTALCVPSAVCLIVVSKGKSVLSASDKALQYMPFIKLANGILFLLFAVFFAFG